ncbi:MAG: sigma-70 family RNA polymerase sigma factor [Candidatus Gracilibacteria bacterium]|nr:sigma-70 family RNA polymerase sigma factor [Candidatus Gracilibacteria bacterium]
MDEIGLINLCKSGDSQAFGIIYDRYIDKVYDFIYFKTYDKFIAEDITSDTFFKVLKGLNKFDTQKENFSLKSWILKIAYNNVVDYYRSKKEEVGLDDIIEKGIENNIGDEIDNKAKLKEVLDYLKGLEQSHREILIMRIWENLSYAEISEITGKTQDNCKKIVSRTLVKVNSNVTLLLLLLLNM